MKRLHLFEFNDQTWLPQSLRNAIVETLGQGLESAGVYDPIAPIFEDFCRRTGCRTVLDLCSGSGEPVSLLIRALKKSGASIPAFILSDLFPDVRALERVRERHPGVVEISPSPVDATRVDASLDCQAIMVNNAFHHFDPFTAKRILSDAVEKRRAVFIIEGMNGEFPRYFPLLVKLLASGARLAVKKRRSRLSRLKRLLLSAGPLAPLGVWDGAVSQLRTYRPNDLFSMVSDLDGDYCWEHRESPYFIGGRCVVFMGIPNPKRAG